MTTVGQLRQICEDILFLISGWDDDVKIRTGPSTYGMGYTVLETEDGFFDYTDIQEDDDDYCEEVDE